MTRRINARLLVAGIVSLCIGCALGDGGVRAVEELGPPTLRLASAVHGVAERPADYGYKIGAGGGECLRLAVEDDPELLSPLRGYIVRVACDGGVGAVLVCDPEGTRALLEDLGCTAALDYRAGSGDARGCAFALEPQTICPR